MSTAGLKKLSDFIIIIYMLFHISEKFNYDYITAIDKNFMF